MNTNEAERRIAALTAIVQVLISEAYFESSYENGRKLFDQQFTDDEALAITISNELSEEAIAQAFAAAATGVDQDGDELATSPLVPYLQPEQMCRARVALLADRESDHAHTLAVRSPGRGAQPLSTDKRVLIGEEAFLGRIEIDVLHEQNGWSDFTARADADSEARIACLPEPWRGQVHKRLPELRARIRETVENQ